MSFYEFITSLKNKYSNYSKLIDIYTSNIKGELLNIDLKEYDYLLEDESINSLKRIYKILKTINRNKVYEQVSYFKVSNAKSLIEVVEIYEFILQVKYSHLVKYYSYNNLDKLKLDLNIVSKLWQDLNVLNDEITKYYKEEVYNLDIEDLIYDLNNTKLTLFSPKLNKIKKILKDNLIVKKNLNNDTIKSDLDLINKAIIIKREILSKDLDLKECFKEYYHGLTTDFIAIESIINYLQKYKLLEDKIKKYVVDLNVLLTDISNLNTKLLNAEYEYIKPYSYQLADLKIDNISNLFESDLKSLLKSIAYYSIDNEELKSELISINYE